VWKCWSWSICLLALSLSGCFCCYEGIEYKPTGFSSTHHKYELEERMRLWYAQREKLREEAATQRRLAGLPPEKQDNGVSESAQIEMPATTQR